MTKTFFQCIEATFSYWICLFSFIFLKTTFEKGSEKYYKDDVWARVQVYSLSLIFKLWNKPHYRCASFQQDMLDNLKNVAIPGTGVPLSIFCYSKYLCMYFVFFINPFICLCGAINKANLNANEASKDKLLTWSEYFNDRLLEYYYNHLLHPDDWFSFWRLNCRLVAYHALITNSSHYELEDKWSFLKQGHKLGVAVSPFLIDIEQLVCKHKSIEGGMGIHMFKNATNGGDWILQKRLHNAKWLNNLLPKNAPLSTMRVITFSRWGLKHLDGPPDFFAEDDTDEHAVTEDDASTHVFVLSAVLRLGRENAVTDHSSVMFDVDIPSSRVRKGVSNAHWYQLGIQAPFTCPWLPQEQNIDTHPDPPNATITGYEIPGLKDAITTVTNAHFKMLAEVPIVGWDVCFTTHGVCFLEVNLSCNFFRGSFDIPCYLAHVEQYFKKLEKMEQNNYKK